jgi:hypothetical protein
VVNLRSYRFPYLVIEIHSAFDLDNVRFPSPTASTLDTPSPATKLDHLSQEEQDALRAAVFQRLHPRAYLERYIAEDVRPDGRTFLEFRDVYVNVGTFVFCSGGRQGLMILKVRYLPRTVLRLSKWEIPQSSVV